VNTGQRLLQEGDGLIGLSNKTWS